MGLIELTWLRTQKSSPTSYRERFLSLRERRYGNKWWWNKGMHCSAFYEMNLKTKDDVKAKIVQTLSYSNEFLSKVAIGILIVCSSNSSITVYWCATEHIKCSFPGVYRKVWKAHVYCLQTGISGIQFPGKNPSMYHHYALALCEIFTWKQCLPKGHCKLISCYLGAWKQQYIFTGIYSLVFDFNFNWQEQKQKLLSSSTTVHGYINRQEGSAPSVPRDHWSHNKLCILIEVPLSVKM